MRAILLAAAIVALVGTASTSFEQPEPGSAMLEAAKKFIGTLDSNSSKNSASHSTAKSVSTGTSSRESGWASR